VVENQLFTRFEGRVPGRQNWMKLLEVGPESSGLKKQAASPGEEDAACSG